MLNFIDPVSLPHLNKNTTASRSGSAARLLDTPSDLSDQEMTASSESDEHLSTVISLRIDELSSGRSPVMTPQNDVSTNTLWPGNGQNGKLLNGLNGNINLRLCPPTNGTLPRPASSMIDISEEIDREIDVSRMDLSRLPFPSPSQPMIRDKRLRIKPEIILAFLMAGLGNVAAGYMLAKVPLI